MKLYEYLSTREIAEGKPIVIRDDRFSNVFIKYKAPFCDSSVKHRMMIHISKFVDIREIISGGVVTNISEIIERSIDNSMYDRLHLPTDMNELMPLMNDIFSSQSNDFWMVQFVSLIHE